MFVLHVCADPENYRLAEADGAQCVKLMPEWSKGYVRQATALFYQVRIRDHGRQRRMLCATDSMREGLHTGG